MEIATRSASVCSTSASCVLKDCELVGVHIQYADYIVANCKRQQHARTGEWKINVTDKIYIINIRCDIWTVMFNNQVDIG